MTYRIQNAHLTVEVDALGAQLRSIRTADGCEYLWQGDPAYWRDRAPNIFPYVARLTGGKYQMDGALHEMAIHGFASRMPFALAAQEAQALTLRLEDNAQTFAQYPRRFVFSIRYALRENTLDIRYRVENRDARTLYFGLGGHPGFNVPLTAGLRFEDYHLRFEEPCAPRRIGFTEACFLDGTDSPFPLASDRILPLRHDCFDDDAIVLKDMSRRVTLEAPGDSRSVTVEYPQMPYLGIWHRPRTDAPYVCIEPWMSLPSTQDKLAVFEEQPDLISLEPGGHYENEWRIILR